MADTRRQILLTVREQARLLKEPVGPIEQGAVQQQWSPQQWWESFTFLFVNHIAGADHHYQDDLLFFVRRSPSTAGNPPVFVRRKAKQLPDDLQLSGKDFNAVDWASTVLLNLVLHSQYQLTVVACGPESLPFVAEGRTWAPGMITVSKPVYASTTVTPVNLDSSRDKASNPQPCYPDICFAVDNFDNAFEDVVLEDASKRYCVVLHAILDQHEASTDYTHDLAEVAARITNQRLLGSSSQPGNGSQNSSNNSSGHGGSSRPPQQQQIKHSSTHGEAQGQSGSSGGSDQAATAASSKADTAQQSTTPAAAAGAAAGTESSDAGQPARNSSTSDGSSTWQISTHKRTLFAAYVSCGQILDFMESRNNGGKSMFDSWLKGSKQPPKDKVIMTGPGGVGRCEVAVTKLDKPTSTAPARSSAAGSNDNGSHHAAAAASGVGASGNSSSQAAGSSSTTADGTAASPQPAAAAPVGQQQQQEKKSMFQRGLQRARFVASGVQQALDVLSDLNPSGTSYNMLCELMSLRLPVQSLANELLQAL